MALIEYPNAYIVGKLDRIWKWILFSAKALLTGIIPMCFIIIKDKWINNFIVSWCYDIILGWLTMWVTRLVRDHWHGVALRVMGTPWRQDAGYLS